MKILLLTKYDTSGASSRYRTIQYLNFLKPQDMHITLQSLLDHRYIMHIFNHKKLPFLYYIKKYIRRFLALKKNNYDFLWIEGEIFPYCPWFIEKWFLPKHAILEYDDAIYLNYEQHKNPWIRKLLGKKIAKLMQYAKHVIVGNEYVKNYALSNGVLNVTVLPTVVDSDRYKPAIVPPLKKITLGWLGSPTTIKYLKILEPLFKELSHENIRLLVIGGEYHSNILQTTCFYWQDEWQENEEIAYLNEIDVGIMPLNDSPWEYGKCGFKLIKYMAMEKPVVATPISSNCEIVQHGINGFLASSLSDWKKYLLMLIHDEVLRKKMGKNGRKWMIKHYSLQKTVPLLKEVLETVYTSTIKENMLCAE